MKKIFILSYAILSFVLILTGVFFVMLFTLKVEEYIDIKVNIKNGMAEIPNIKNWSEGDTIRIRFNNNDYLTKVISGDTTKIKVEFPYKDTTDVSILVVYGREIIAKRIIDTYLKKYRR